MAEVLNPGLVGTERAAALMKQGGLWARIVSIFLILAFLLMGLMGILALLAVFTGAVRHRDAPPLVIAGIAYLVNALFYPIPTIFLFQFASAAKAFSLRRDEVSLERALKAQKSFWKSVGITIFVIIFLSIVAGLGVGVLVAMDSHMFR